VKIHGYQVKTVMICFGTQQIAEFLPPGNTVNGGYVFGGQHVIYVFADEDKIGGSNTDLRIPRVLISIIGR